MLKMTVNGFTEFDVKVYAKYEYKGIEVIQTAYISLGGPLVRFFITNMGTIMQIRKAEWNFGPNEVRAIPLSWAEMNSPTNKTKENKIDYVITTGKNRVERALDWLLTQWA